MNHLTDDSLSILRELAANSIPTPGEEDEDDGYDAQFAYEEATREAAAERQVRATWWGGR